MTVVGIFGDATASDKLVKAALNDTLEAHMVDHANEEFWLCIGVRRPTTTYETIIGWALRNGIWTSVYTMFDSPAWEAAFDGGEFEVAEWHHSSRFMIDVVERLLAEPRARVFALMGDQDPPVDVRRALVRALDNGLEVRDLAEAGLTYVGVSDNPLTTRSIIIMANDLTLAEAGEAADNEDEESMLALTTLAADYGLDPDDYATWSLLADALDPLMAEAPDAGGDDPDPEPEEAPRRRGKKESLTREELEELSVPELRQLAKQMGVEGWDKNRSAKLIDGIIEAQDGAVPLAGEDETGEGEVFATLEGFNFLPLLAAGLRAFADAIDR